MAVGLRQAGNRSCLAQGLTVESFAAGSCVAALMPLPVSGLPDLPCPEVLIELVSESSCGLQGAL